MKMTSNQHLARWSSPDCASGRSTGHQQADVQAMFDTLRNGWLNRVSLHEIVSNVQQMASEILLSTNKLPSVSFEDDEHCQLPPTCLRGQQLVQSEADHFNLPTCSSTTDNRFNPKTQSNAQQPICIICNPDSMPDLLCVERKPSPTESLEQQPMYLVTIVPWSAHAPPITLIQGVFFSLDSVKGL